MAHQLPTYLKTYRKQTHLTQHELAHLLGLSDGSKVSRLERRQTDPSIKVVIACQVLFDTQPHEVFPGIYDEVEELVANRARVLLQSLITQEQDEKRKRKVEYLTRIAQASGARDRHETT